MRQVLIAFDQLINTLFGGKADETISARAYRLSEVSFRWYVLMRFIDVLFFWERAHCLASYEAEVKRKHLPSEYTNA